MVLTELLTLNFVCKQICDEWFARAPRGHMMFIHLSCIHDLFCSHAPFNYLHTTAERTGYVCPGTHRLSNLCVTPKM